MMPIARGFIMLQERLINRKTFASKPLTGTKKKSKLFRKTGRKRRISKVEQGMSNIEGRKELLYIFEFYQIIYKLPYYSETIE